MSAALFVLLDRSYAAQQHKLRLRKWQLVVAVVMMTTACGAHQAPGANRPDSIASSAATDDAPMPTRTPAPPQKGAPDPRTVTILGSGDVLVHPPLVRQAHIDGNGAGYDFGPIYASIAPDVTGTDLAICELETPLAPAAGPYSGWPNFNAPPQVLATLKALGYRSCTTASNHTLDQGAAGITRTLNALDKAGLQHTGSARSAHEAATPLIVTTAKGVKIAQLAYTFGFNGNQLPAGREWAANLTGIPAILKAARHAKQAGADIVVVSMHWGVEYTHSPTRLQKQQAAALLASPDIDLVLGDHAHAVQPAEKINGKWVVYCMGDQVSAHSPPNDDNREGVLARFTFTELAPGRFTATGAEMIPTWMQLRPSYRLIDLPRALANPSTAPADAATYSRVHDQIATYLDSLGAGTDGLIVR